ncbi:hypothetical protein PRIPAC_72213 [Pristionchus pacificus]|uniref:Uncharacterized protein n=1 Tax=Pristionchus pacificus TaxID=54126 RepID=A0A2A6C5I2_PRIPA|nr:hypothetical protein PRIPAC_72213 [Pristionchus pacificus]|eukprot:PDM73435.1 hypothetical protein PRIPAC_40791 [Pristionchus pacificus]
MIRTFLLILLIASPALGKPLDPWIKTCVGLLHDWLLELPGNDYQFAESANCVLNLPILFKYFVDDSIFEAFAGNTHEITTRFSEFTTCLHKFADAAGRGTVVDQGCQWAINYGLDAFGRAYRETP